MIFGSMTLILILVPRWRRFQNVKSGQRKLEPSIAELICRAWEVQIWKFCQKYQLNLEETQACPGENRLHMKENEAIVSPLSSWEAVDANVMPKFIYHSLQNQKIDQR